MVYGQNALSCDPLIDYLFTLASVIRDIHITVGWQGLLFTVELKVFS